MGPAVHRGMVSNSYALYPCVMRVRGQQQECWKRCENGSNIGPTSAITEQKKYWDGQLLAQKFDRFQTLRNNSQQHAATYNNIQHCLHTNATCNIQRRWKLLASNVPSVCTGLKVLVAEDVSLSCFVFMSQERAQTREGRALWDLCKQRALVKDKFPTFVPFEKLTALRLSMLMNYLFL